MDKIGTLSDGHKEAQRRECGEREREKGRERERKKGGEREDIAK